MERGEQKGEFTMARGKEVDQAMVDLVLNMKARNEKLTTAQIGAVVQCDATTVGRIIRGGSWEGYCALKAEKARQEREKNRAPAEEPAEEQVPGQIAMELEPEKPEMSDQTKMMRFQAAQVDKLIVQYGQWMDVINMRLEKLNDTMSMVLRAVRKE